MRGRGSLRFKTASCCRRATFSKRRSRREGKNTITGTGKSFTRHSTRAVFHGNMVHWIPAHLHDSTADRYFGEPQLYRHRLIFLRRRGWVFRLFNLANLRYSLFPALGFEGSADVDTIHGSLCPHRAGAALPVAVRLFETSRVMAAVEGKHA